MGKRGPKPKATKLRLLEGNPSRRPINDMEPGCELPPVKPRVVEADEIASAEWDRVIAAMPPDIYTALDVSALMLYAQAFSLMTRAQDEIALRGITEKQFRFDKDSGELVSETVVENPAVGIWKKASESLIKAVDRLGLAPGVRSRLSLPDRNAKPQSRFAGLLGNDVPTR